MNCNNLSLEFVSSNIPRVRHFWERICKEIREHGEALKQFFERMRQAGIIVNP